MSWQLILHLLLGLAVANAVRKSTAKWNMTMTDSPLTPTLRQTRQNPETDVTCLTSVEAAQACPKGDIRKILVSLYNGIDAIRKDIDGVAAQVTADANDDTSDLSPETRASLLTFAGELEAESNQLSSLLSIIWGILYPNQPKQSYYRAHGVSSEEYIPGLLDYNSVPSSPVYETPSVYSQPIEVSSYQSFLPQSVYPSYPQNPQPSVSPSYVQLPQALPSYNIPYSSGLYDLPQQPVAYNSVIQQAVPQYYLQTAPEYYSQPIMQQAVPEYYGQPIIPQAAPEYYSQAQPQYYYQAPTTTPYEPVGGGPAYGSISIPPSSYSYPPLVSPVPASTSAPLYFPYNPIASSNTYNQYPPVNGQSQPQQQIQYVNTAPY